MAQDTKNVAPPMAKKAKFLRDADGTLYPWVPELAARGDLVAAYDPENPTAYSSDQAQIALNRELELAKERADAEEVARLEAQKRMEEEAAKRAEAEEVAQANQRNLAIANEKLAELEIESAKKIAELQAQLDAMAKQQASGATVAEEDATPPAEKKAPAKKAPAKKVKETTETKTEAEEPTDIDLDDLGE